MLEQASIHAWIQKNRIVNEFSKPIEFVNHFFLFDIVRDFSQHIACMKGTQIGMSTMEILMAVYAARYRKFNIIYSLPTDSDVSEFVRTKFDKMASVNSGAFGVKGTDNVGLKAIGDRFIMFKGTVSKTAQLMSSADVLIHDEIDRSDLNMIQGMQSRTDHSDFGGIWKLSNPSTTGIGIDKAYQDSDRKVWHITCRKCGAQQPLTFDDNVDKEREIYICAMCGKLLTGSERAVGSWIPTQPGHMASGYHINQLMAPWISAKKLMRDFREKDPEHFFNFNLGLPYEDSDVVVNEGLILENWTTTNIHKPPYYLGVDVGKIKYFVLSSEKGRVAVGRFEDWSYLDELMKRYDPLTVIDAGPDITMPDVYRKRYPGRVWKCYFTKDKQRADIAKWGDNDNYGVIWADRSRLIGKLVHNYQLGDIMVAIKSGDELERFIRHWKTVRRLREEDKSAMSKVESTLNLSPDTRYVWTTVSDEDHYVFADCYCELARTQVGKPDFISVSGNNQRGVIEQTDHGVFEMDLKQAMLDAGYHDTEE